MLSKSISYKAYYPSEFLSRYIKYYWHIVVNRNEEIPEILLPDLTAKIIFNTKSSSYIMTDLVTKRVNELSYSYIGGLTTHGFECKVLDDNNENLELIGVKLTPNGLSLFCDRNVYKLTNNMVKFSDINLPELDYIDKRIKSIPLIQDQIRVLNNYFEYKVISLIPTKNHSILDVITQSLETSTYKVDDLVSSTGWYYKKLERNFKNVIGVEPKVYLKLKRYGKVLERIIKYQCLMICESELNEIGYYDRSHLIKELKSFTGLSPSDLLNTESRHFGVYISQFYNYEKLQKPIIFKELDFAW